MASRIRPELLRGRQVRAVVDWKGASSGTSWQSNVTLDPTFFHEVTTYPVPVDLRALKALRRSPLALDMYCWLTYRLSYLKGHKVIPWGALQVQFGSGYPQDGQGLRNFKKALLRELKKVKLVYQAAKVGSSDRGLELRPSRTHNPQLKAA